MSLVLPSGKPNPYAPQGGYQRPAPQNPWAQWGVDPTKQVDAKLKGNRQQAFDGLQYAAQQGWGRRLTDDEVQRIGAHAQSRGWSGDVVSGQNYNDALGYMEQILGARPTQQQAPPDPPPQVQPRVGAEQATNEWREQARVAGVPATFRSSVGLPERYRSSMELPERYRSSMELPGEFQAPGNMPGLPTNPYQQQQQQLMQQILSNPHTMGEKEQNILAERQKESALRMGAQARAQGQRQQGFGAGGGTAQALNDQTQQNVMQSILQGRQDLAVQMAQQGRMDELQALQASQQMQGQDFNQQMQLRDQMFGQGLQGWNANMQRAQLGFDQDYRSWAADMQRAQLGFDQDYRTWGADMQRAQQGFDQDYRTWGAQQGLSQQALDQMNRNRGSNLQEFLGLHSADMDMLNFGEGRRQFDNNYNLDFMRYLTGVDQFDRSFGENQRQYNNNMGLNWSQFSAQQQQAMMDRILGYGYR